MSKIIVKVMTAALLTTATTQLSAEQISKQPDIKSQAGVSLIGETAQPVIETLTPLATDQSGEKQLIALPQQTTILLDQESPAQSADAKDQSEPEQKQAPIVAAKAKVPALQPEIKITTNPVLSASAFLEAPIWERADQQFDQEIKDQIQAAMKALPKSKKFLTKRDNAAIRSFYEGRDFQAAWYENGELTKSARKLIFALSRADIDGLNPKDYVTPSLTLSRKSDASEEELAAADITLSRAVTRYTRHAYAGRIDPRRFSKKEITIKPHYPDSIKALTEIAAAENPKAKMRSFNPTHNGFVALRAEYNRLRLEPVQAKSTPIPDGKSLKAGMRDKRVALISKKLGFELPEENANLYSKDLAKAVKKFQKANGLVADGIAGKATLKALNGNREEILSDIVANMERWRWLPRDLGQFHVFVNIPTFHVQIVSDDKKIHETRVVVGKTRNKTPVFSDQMEYLVVNPYWNVPKSIASKELLPQIKTDPSAFFSKRNYQVLASVKGRTRVIDPSQLDWSKVEASQVRLRQTPGTRNALGRIKFMFPNRHAVYLHDTPSKSLFKRDYRAFSHGCVRVHKPLEFADVILSQTKKWDAARVKRTIGGNERRVNLDKKIPVHLAYFTTWMSEEGVLQVRSDLYGHNKKVKKLMGL